MAKAKVNKVYTVKDVTLTLSKEEAEALADLIYASVGGTGRRTKLVDAISNALDRAGIEGDDERSEDVDGYVSFK